MAYAKLTIGAKVYDLSHLNNLLVRVKGRSGGAKVFRARVVFGCHTFTKDVEPGDDPQLYYQDGNNMRCFCPIRHDQSLSLPKLFREVANGGGDTYFGNDSNLLILDTGRDGGPYMAAYKIFRPNKQDVDVLLSVRSAYLKPNLPKRLSVLPFYSVVAATARGQQIVQPAARPY